MTQLPNQILSTQSHPSAPVSQMTNLVYQGSMTQSSTTQQNTPLTQSLSMNGIKHQDQMKDTSISIFI